MRWKAGHTRMGFAIAFIFVCTVHVFTIHVPMGQIGVTGRVFEDHRAPILRSGVVLFGSSPGVLVASGQPTEISDGSHGRRAEEKHQHYVFFRNHFHCRDLEIKQSSCFSLRGVGTIADECYKALLLLGRGTRHFVLLLAPVDKPGLHQFKKE